jgi:hypothetical protein
MDSAHIELDERNALLASVEIPFQPAVRASRNSGRLFVTGRTVGLNLWHNQI